MMINMIFDFRRIIIFGLLPIVFILWLNIPSLAQSSSDEIQPTNVKWTVKNEVIVVNYDLTGSSNLKYSLNVIMKRESDSTFSAVPVTVEGDIGEGYFAGTNKEILWYYRRDFPQGLQGEDYYFEIHVKPVAKDNSLLYYIAGGVAVTAGIVALLVHKNPGTPPPTELPFPPVRP
jgi:hypothetical protein